MKTARSDGAPASRAAEPLPLDRQRWAAMPLIALGVSLIIMDATVVNVALPVVIRDLHLSAAGAEWVNSVYPLAFAALLIVLGRVGDRYGRRRLFLTGLALFGAASIVAATAGGAAQLITGRLLQGVGGAMILPATLATVNALFTGRDRNTAFAIWGATIGGMAAVGPFVGGWLTTDFTWRWAFLLNLPVVVLVMLGTLRFVPETTDPRPVRGADIAGTLTSVIGLGTLVFGLIEGQRYGWWTATGPLTVGGWRWPWAISPVLLAFLTAFVALAAFVMVERRRRATGRPVLLDLGLLRIRSFRYGCIAALIVALGEFGLLFALPLVLQGALGYTALRTGALILALALGTFVISGASPQLTNRLGARAVVRIGLVVEAVAVAGLALSLHQGVSGWLLAGWLFGYGAGVGLATAQLTNVILTDVPVTDSGQASGTQSAVRQVGSALGIALLGTMLVVLLGAHTTAALQDVPGLSAAERSHVVAVVRGSAGAAIESLGSGPNGAEVVRASAGALLAATRTVALSAAGVLLLGVFATLALPPARRETLESDTADDDAEE